jgi:hypothetical protein
LLNGLVNCLDRLDPVSAEIMSGSFKFVLGFLQLLDCSPDAWMTLASIVCCLASLL